MNSRWERRKERGDSKGKEGRRKNKVGMMFWSEIKGRNNGTGKNQEWEMNGKKNIEG